MEAEEHLRAGRLEEALASLQNSVRNKPEDPRLRTFLFQLFGVMGKWERSLTQLQVLAGFGPETMMLARIFEPVIHCEAHRAAIFSGKRTPLIFGDPPEWIGSLLQANELVAKGQFKAAAELRDRAFDAAPQTAGKIGDEAFSWIADADPRLGPVLEVILEGRYYWVPFCRIQKIQMEKPKDLRDLAWVSANFMWSNGGEATGFIPARYPGTESSPDGDLRLSRKTDWSEKPEGFFLGLGQRLLTTDQGEYPLLETRKIELSPA